MLDVVNVTKRFHLLTALDNVTLHIPEGEVLGVLGPNGAGKTTLFKLIAGFLYPDTGFIKPTSTTWPNIGYKPERLLFPSNMRVKQYLEKVADLSNLPGGQKTRAISNSLEQVNLAYAANKRIRDCSKGMRQRLGLAQAMIGDPPLLLLDEPSNGLDPEGQSDICEQIEKLHSTGKTIVLASHHLHEVTQVCTRLIILNHGSVHYQNNMQDALAERPHATIVVNRPLLPLRTLLSRLHPDIEVNESSIILNYEAILLRPKVISLLINAGYDIIGVEQRRVTLNEIYAEAVK